MSTLVLLLPRLALAAVPAGPFPGCGPDDLEACPDEMGDWEHISWIPENSLDTVRPAEVPMGAGLWLDVALRVTAGRWDVPIAVLDSGIEWDSTSISRKVHLNAAELPPPQDAGGAEIADWDLDGNGLLNIDDYAQDPRVPIDAGNDSADHMLDASDLIAVFSDGVDDDGNGYVDDIAGWDFFHWDNDPFSTLQTLYGDHGTGIMKAAAAEGDDGGNLGTCPNCSILPLRTGDAFITDGDRLALAITYAADNGARVIANAGAGLSVPGWTAEALAYADARGVVMVAAAGDENSWHHNYPAAEDPVLYVHGVRSLDADPESGGIYSFLNHGNCNNFGPRVDLVAPTGDCASGATGLISGSVGLVFSAALDAGYDLTAAEAKALLRNHADDVWLTEEERALAETYPSAEGFDAFYGDGRINLGRAVEAAAAGLVPPTAAITAPRWFAWPGQRFEVHGVVSTRATSVAWALDVGYGPAPASWTPVASGSGPADGLLGTVEVPQAQHVFDELVDEDVVGRFERAHEPMVMVRLTATEDTGRTAVARRGVWVLDDPAAVPGFPLAPGGSLETSPVLVDADGDGVFEVAVATGGGALHLYDGAGVELPGFPVQTEPIPAYVAGISASAAFASGALGDPPEGALTAPAVGDIDGDGSPDLVLGGLRARVYAWTAQGAPLAGFPVLLEGREPTEIGPETAWDEGVIAQPVLVDVDGDGAMEILVASTDQKLTLFDGSGEVLPGYPMDLCIDCSVGARIVSSPAVGDIDGDGDLDAALGTNEIPTGDAGYLFAIDLGEARVWDGYPLERDGLINQEILPVVGSGHPSAVALADLDGDGDLELFGGALLSTPSVLHHDGTTAAELLYAADGYGSDASFSEGSFLSMVTNPSFGDLDLDGVPDPVLGGASVMYLLSLPLAQWSDYQHALGAWSGRYGNAMPGFPRQVDDVAFLSAAAIADVSGDALPETLYGTGGHFVYAWDATGALAPGWPHFTGGWSLSAPAVGDIDGDGFVEVVAGIREGTLFAWHTSGRADQAVQWSGARHDAQHTGNAHTPLPPQPGPAYPPSGCCGGSGIGKWALVPLLPLWLLRRRPTPRPHRRADPEPARVDRRTRPDPSER